MDYIFNKQIPRNNSTRIIFRPIGKTFVNGLAPGYKHILSPSEKQRISQFIAPDKVEDAIYFINEEVIGFWPCPLCFFCGYGCALCTVGKSIVMYKYRYVGTSFLFPMVCMKDAEEALRNVLARYNRDTFLPHKLKLTFQKKCSTSWVILCLFIYYFIAHIAFAFP